MVEKYLQNKKLFNIILMDIIMPKMDGYESAQKIRELEKRYGVPERDRQFICGYSANVSLRKYFIHNFDLKFTYFYFGYRCREEML